MLAGCFESVRCVRARACVCVCVRIRVRARVCVRVCVRVVERSLIRKSKGAFDFKSGRESRCALGAHLCWGQSAS